MEVASGRSNFLTGFSGEMNGWIDIADHCWLVLLGSSPGLPAAFSLSETPPWRSVSRRETNDTELYGSSSDMLTDERAILSKWKGE